MLPKIISQYNNLPSTAEVAGLDSRTENTGNGAGKFMPRQLHAEKPFNEIA
jgi:hypothetical protein